MFCDFNVKVVKTLPTAQIPKYQTEGAAGFDFHSAVNEIILPGETKLISTGLAFKIPSYHEIQVRPRSGLSLKTKIRVSNSPGTVDEDFSGTVCVILDNIGTEPFTVNIGDRIAQGVLCPIKRAIFTELSELPETTRSSSGFGSTGV